MISIIIPTLNEAKYLGLLLSQFSNDLIKKFNIEIIVSDGGSSDNTIEIAKRYTDRVLLHDPRKKQTIAEGRNRGAKESKGEILFFINADTFIENIERFFEIIVKELAKPDIVALTCKVQVFPDEEKLSDKIFHTFHN